VSSLDRPGPRLARIGEGASLEAEQLRFDQGRRDGRAVEVDEGARRAGACLVDGPREQSLAGARLALEQDRRHSMAHPEARSQALNVGQNRADRLAAPQ